MHQGYYLLNTDCNWILQENIKKQICLLFYQNSTKSAVILEIDIIYCHINRIRTLKEYDKQINWSKIFLDSYALFGLTLGTK